MFKKFVYPLYAPEDLSGGFSGGESDDEKISADIDLLEDEDNSGDDDTATEEDEDDEAVKEDEDELSGEDDEPTEDEPEEGEEKEDEKEEQEKDEEGLPEPLRFSQIKKEYPDFFKKFPQFKGLVQGYYGFTKVFGSVEEATEAAEVVENYNSIASDIFNGNADTFLDNIKTANKQGYDKFVSNLLPGLFKADQAAYYKVATPIVDGVFKSLYQDGLKESNKNKTNSAIIAAATTFNISFEEAEQRLKSRDSGYREPEKTERETELERKNEELLRTNFEALNSRVEGDLESELKKEFLKGAGSDWSEAEKRVFLEDCFKELRRTLNEDKAHSGRMNALWKKEQADSFRGRGAESIKKAVLSRAAASIPSIRLKVKGEMGKLTKKSKADDKKSVRDKNRNVPAGKQSNFSGRKVTAKTDPRTVDWRKSSDLDILNDKVHFKG